ncbi:interleukin-1 family member A [Anoplopoma fimbria]|uniref:interleukin-1 family member A n=1 Tax=Anoplopoma fimbria TaxID=229290 RepID=UPI0023EACD78|nr:interleukin-1 family member A [Anoplopoma fimbria]
MDLEGSVVKGGVLIVHNIHEGKHQYEVENVKYKRASKKVFVRRGDKLMQINGMDLQDLTPEELAQLLAEANPMLTVHKASMTKEHTEQFFPAEETLHPFSKESTVLSFSMEMRRTEDLEENGVGQKGDGKEDGGLEEEGCQPEDQENGERGDLLIVSMMKTSISVVSGRGCDSESPCPGCNGTGCTFNDVVMVSESSKVMLVARGGGSFSQLKSLNTPVEHWGSHYYLRGLCSEKAIYASPNPEEMTIYYYKSTPPFTTFRGQPVVLNFSKSNCFLRCCKEGDRVFLQAETCEKQRLKKISKSDEVALSFVFYTKSEVTRQRTFESALHSGWFIQIDTSNSVEMATLDGGRGEESFLFIIQT